MADSRLNTGEQIQSIWALGGLSVRQLAVRVWNGINDHDLLGLASQLAYGFILSIFPMLLFLLSVFGLFAARGTQMRSSLLFYLAEVLPPAAYQLVSKTLEEVMKNSGTAKITLGLFLALFSASGGLTSMISGLNSAYGIREGRPWWKTRAIALGLTIALSVLALTAIVVVLVGGPVATFVGGKLGLGWVLVLTWRISQWPLALFFVACSFSLLYFFGPDVKEQHWYWITPGSILGVVLWLAASFGFRIYLHYFNTYSRTYGSLGAAIILLIWFYVTGLTFLVGGEINAEIEHAAAERGHPEAKAEGEKLSPSDLDQRAA